MSEKPKKRYFYDTEFIEDGRTIDLISIAIICEDGRQLYLQNEECDFAKASDWVVRHVLVHLSDFDLGSRRPAEQKREDDWRSRLEIAHALQEFCDPEKHGKPQLIAYYADYDHVALCQLFGTMMKLPTGWPMYTYDVKQLCDDLGNPVLPAKGEAEHHALVDALWCKVAYNFLIDRLRRLTTLEVVGAADRIANALL